MYHMIGCPCVSCVSFMIKTAKRWRCEKREIPKRSLYIRIINENFPPNYKVSWKELEKKKEALVYYAHQSHAYIKAYVQQHL